MFRGLLCFLLFVILSSGTVIVEPIFEAAGAFTDPVDIQSPEGSDYVYVVEKEGIISVFQKENTRASTTFLDIRSRVDNRGSELGLLGLAFHPNYSSNNQFFVYYCSLNAETLVSRFSSNSELIADSSSEEIILQIPRPFNNHNGGQIQFDREGLLYIAVGDGGGGGDPLGSGQDTFSLLGSLLRINIDATGPAGAYSIPSDNPFSITGGAPEIYSYGLRNPWRFHIDFATNFIWIGDVGQGSFEEISVATTPGQNFGWDKIEGCMCSSDPCEDSFDLPIHSYPRNIGTSITGGKVFRVPDSSATTIPELHDHYFFADFVSGRVFSLDVNELSPDCGTNANLLFETSHSISTFGLVASSLLYADFNGGFLYQISAQSSSSSPLPSPSSVASQSHSRSLSSVASESSLPSASRSPSSVASQSPSVSVSRSSQDIGSSNTSESPFPTLLRTNTPPSPSPVSASASRSSVASNSPSSSQASPSRVIIPSLSETQSTTPFSGSRTSVASNTPSSFPSISTISSPSSIDSASVTPEAPRPPSSFSKSVTSIEGDIIILIEWHIDGEFIHFRATAPAAGWIAIGFSTDGSMDSNGEGSDMVMGFQDKNGKEEVHDYFSQSRSVPDLDEQENLFFTSIKKLGGSLELSFTRFIEPVDSFQDRPLFLGTGTFIIWAVSDDLPDAIETFSRHSARESVLVELSSPVTVSPSSNSFEGTSTTSDNVSSISRSSDTFTTFSITSSDTDSSSSDSNPPGGQGTASSTSSDEDENSDPQYSSSGASLVTFSSLIIAIPIILFMNHS